MAVNLRQEYPRPSLVRERWLSLNGKWQFDFDDQNQGLKEKWFSDAKKLSQKINVPYAYQTPNSGINSQEYHEVVWYARDFEVPSEWRDDRILLHFGAVDWEATVWVNGIVAGKHKGGYVPFSFDITDLLQQGSNQLVVRVVDEDRINQPRGKQTATKQQWGCWYIPVTGIWQSVWLEPVSATRFTDIFLRPDIDGEKLTIEYTLSQLQPGLSIEVVATDEGEILASAKVAGPSRISRWLDAPLNRGTVNLSVPSPKLWSPENPFLYDLVLRLKDGDEVLDELKTYFGMRKVHIDHGQVYLNNRPYYQRLILDQGYWVEGLYTAPSVEALRRDVELTKAMGFNGARKHQKIEDPYFYYFCDKLGLLVWSEMPACYEYDVEGAERLRREWTEAVLRDRNHPSIIAWVPINEGWGVDQLKGRVMPEATAHLMGLYYQTKSLDPTRLVVSNDGWQHAKTDMLTIHEYTQDKCDLKERYEAFRGNRHKTAFSHGLPILLPDFNYDGAPILVTEFGGVKVEEQQAEGWGYGKAALDYEEMVERIKGLVDVILEQDEVVGYCYTQLTDVQQEVNGLLDANHNPKVEVELYKAAFRGK
ncbi:MAG: glycoside hydrolase family 2 [Firmicutes bacterium]|jgi:beta-galactosidase/beta-glucuronidase|nr:glycoside hydrolase family 2 [Bacillota bacterium]